MVLNEDEKKVVRQSIIYFVAVNTKGGRWLAGKEDLKKAFRKLGGSDFDEKVKTFQDLNIMSDYIKALPDEAQEWFKNIEDHNSIYLM